MSEFAPEGGAGSQENQEGSAGAVTPPQNTSSADSSAAGGDADARSREWQSRYDRAAARNVELERRLTELEAKNDGGDRGGLTPKDIESTVFSTILRGNALMRSAEALRTEFPLVARVNGDLFDRLDQYDSPEQMRERIASYNEMLAGAVKDEVDRGVAGVRGEYEKRFGQIAPPPPDGGQAAGGDPTLEQVAAMSFDERAAFEAQHPGLLDRVLERSMSE